MVLAESRYALLETAMPSRGDNALTQGIFDQANAIMDI
jgi:hypothetical protein